MPKKICGHFWLIRERERERERIPRGHMKTYKKTNQKMRPTKLKLRIKNE